MNGRGPIWRAIFWVERFLPAPVPTSDQARRAQEARGRAAFVPLMMLLVVVPTLVRERHELGGVIWRDHVALAQSMLVLAGCVALAAVGFGLKAWRDVRRVR